MPFLLFKTLPHCKFICHQKNRFKRRTRFSSPFFSFSFLSFIHSFTLHYITLHYITLHYIPFHSIPFLHSFLYITFHSIPFLHSFLSIPFLSFPFFHSFFRSLSIFLLTLSPLFPCEGLIYNAEHVSTRSTVAIKERLKEDRMTLQCWKQEIEMLKRIETIQNFTTCRLFFVLDDTSRKIPQKFCVLEWIDVKIQTFFLTNLPDLSNSFSFKLDLNFLKKKIEGTKPVQLFASRRRNFVPRRVSFCENDAFASQ